MTDTDTVTETVHSLYAKIRKELESSLDDYVSNALDNIRSDIVNYVDAALDEPAVVQAWCEHLLKTKKPIWGYVEEQIADMVYKYLGYVDVSPSD
jgi:hypothetical protein